MMMSLSHLYFNHFFLKHDQWLSSSLGKASSDFRFF